MKNSGLRLSRFQTFPLCFLLSALPHHFISHFISTSKSSTSSLVSSVPLRLPTAHTNLVLEALIRHTTPPLPPLSNVTRFRMNSPVFRSHSLTVPSSELVMTKFLLNWRHVTALWCLWGPANTTRDCEINSHCSTAVTLHNKTLPNEINQVFAFALLVVEQI